MFPSPLPDMGSSRRPVRWALVQAVPSALLGERALRGETVKDVMGGAWKQATLSPELLVDPRLAGEDQKDPRRMQISHRLERRWLEATKLPGEPY